VKSLSPLLLANALLVVSLACSVFFRGRFDGGSWGMHILRLTDAISLFGILIWLLIGVFWLIERAKGNSRDAQ
jgi:hypothetical protein